VKYAGELAALGTAVCWAIGANLFTAAGRRMGPVVLNRHRLLVGALLLASALWVTRGAPWPTWASTWQVTLLAASGLIGFAIGDTWFFRALVILGAGRAVLMAALAPLITAAIGWPLLGERLGPLALLGMALTVGGVAWVLMEQKTHEHASRHGRIATGVVAGVLAALGQAIGYVLSKMALRTGIDPLSANVIRITVGAVAIWSYAAVRGQVGDTMRAVRDRGTAAFMLGGTVFGPVLGVVLSLVALAHIEAGVAASIIAINPVLTLVISSRFHGEPFTARSLLGALIAIAGVVVLFMR
jgi:drug/metabolite transporter (DMT)-like permease